jgi:hypothetical protein
MAQTPKRLGLTRDQLASFLSDFEQIKQFEQLFSSVDQINNFSIDEVSIAADNAGASANDALAQISFIAQETQLLALAPPDLGGTVTSVGLSTGTTGLTVTGRNPITTSGTFTLGGILNVANGGTGTSTAFTQGSIVFAGASGVYSQDNANLNWDDTNNTLGVGRTASANVRIYAKGGTTGSGAFQFYGENSAATGCFGVRDDGAFFTGLAALSPYNLTTAAAANLVVGSDGYLYRSTATSGSGTVTSVDVSGGTTGLTTSGGPITTSGTITIGGTLAVSHGGTNSTATPTAGGIAYGTGTAYAFSSAGTAGQFLTSTGGGTPTWSTASSPFGNPAYWGSFWDTTDQSAVAANTAYAVTLNSADPSNNGTTVVSGSRVTFAHAGIYSLIFSIQFMNTDNQIHDANVWLKKNGTNIPDTDTKLSIQNKHGSINGYGLMTVNFVLSLAAGDYIEMFWAATNTSISIQSEPAGTTPVTPSVPGVVFTAVNAPHIGIGYAGVASTTSMTIGTGSKTFTTNVSSTDTAFTVGNRVRLIHDATNYMEGTITAFSSISMTVDVDTTAGSGTYATWSVGLTGVVNTGVTSFSGGSTGLTPATATSGAVTLAGTLGVGYGGTGQASYTNGQLLIGNSTGNTLTKATLTAGTNVSITNGAGSITINATDQYVGTVTSVSVTSGNGFAGTVANATTTPAITLSTTVTGIVKGNGTALSAASAGTDYVAPGAITTSGLTMATARLLGRTTASTGAVQEITIGTGLSLSAGSLSNSAPDQTVSITGAGTTVVTGTYPNFTITSNDQYVGTVTSVSGTGTVNGITLTGSVTSSGSLTLGGTLSNVSLTTQVTGTLPVGNGGTGTATAFTTGSIVFANSSGIYAQDNANFNWNNTNKTLGVGRTASSNVRVYSKGGTTGSGAFSYYGENSAGTGCFGIRDDGAFYTGAASLSPYNLTTAAAANLVVAADYYLYRSTSSARYKKNIVDYDRGLAAVRKLRAVYYEGKGEIDEGQRFAGFVAEEVYDSGLTEFVVLDKEGKPDALHYGNMAALFASAIDEIALKLERIEAALGIEDGDNS